MQDQRESREQGIVLGVSSCLLGNKVRYDGGHKYDPFLNETLGRFVSYFPVCPEVECGLGVPRPPIRLWGDSNNPRLVARDGGADVTDRMRDWVRARLEELAGLGLCGYIFKSRSPSCGPARIKVFRDKGGPAHDGAGIFAAMFTQRFPLLPVEDEGRLNDPVLRENFIERIFVFKRFKDMLERDRSKNGLIRFHTRHKLLVMAHSPQHYRELGRLAASSDSSASILDELLQTYARVLDQAMRLKSTPSKNLNVLQHVMGYFKKLIDSDEKQELLEVFNHYRQGLVPLIVPVTLLNHYVRKYDQPYLKEQFYLNPHPVELKLRNHV